MKRRDATAAAGASRTLRRDGDTFVGRFVAMASPCEVLVDTDSRPLARRALAIAADEAQRIERKFSRYRSDSVVARINASNGEAVDVDDETANLLDYAAECHALSEGSFDVTSGVLRRVWTFDGGERVPDPQAVAGVLAHVGWSRVAWARPRITLERGMEIDLGGIGKEYAVDRAAGRVGAELDAPVLVNFGGDLFASGPRRGGRAWIVGVDDPERTGSAAPLRIEIERGGLATSGDARRFVRWQGRRLGHILDPRTGWPVADAPAAVTVLAGTCLEAGTLATLAILHGSRARTFLEGEGARHWVF